MRSRLAGAVVLGIVVTLPILETSPSAASNATAGPHAKARRTTAADRRRPKTHAGCVNANLMPKPTNLAAIDAATLCLVNGARRDVGLPALVENVQLDRAAVGHSADMIINGYFDHTGPDGLSAAGRVLASGFVPTRGIGENIGAATLSGATPAAMIARWLGSPPHRANMLNPSYSQTGLGIAAAAPATLGNQPGATYTEEFA